MNLKRLYNITQTFLQAATLSRTDQFAENEHNRFAKAPQIFTLRNLEVLTMYKGNWENFGPKLGAFRIA